MGVIPPLYTPSFSVLALERLLFLISNHRIGVTSTHTFPEKRSSASLSLPWAYVNAAGK